ncbi:MAG TPA: PQQ-binding-like beta-propeller repeat protein [Gemmataceae bacterium]|nr:PQQ-binding-like beta-propeller repeat protein [Gemmataceae bacterium]
MRTGSRFAFAILLLFLATLPLRRGTAQPLEEHLRKVILPGEAREWLGRLEAADRLAAQQMWTPALDEYVRLLQEGGDDLVPETTPRDRAGSTRRSVQLRHLCHQRIAALPPAALTRYRARVDPQAKRWLQQGTAARDINALRRIVDEAFLSRFADPAIDLLGDLAFERGNFAEARRWWRLLTPSVAEAAEPDSGRFAYPNSTIDVAHLRAKQILALLFEGDRQQALEELAAFRRLHGKAAGWLAGREGNYATIMQGLFDVRKDGPLSHEEGHWATFAGSPSRNRILVDELSERLWVNGPAWSVRLDPSDAEDPVRPPPPPARRLSCHPVIADKQVLIADARHVTAYDVRSGKLLFRYTLGADGKGDGANGQPPELPANGRPHSTLTIHGDAVYARLGAQALSPPGKEKKGADPGSTYLVCLERFPGPGGSASGRARWSMKAAEAEGERIAYEGAPLAHDGRVYIAQTTLSATRTRTAIACHDADNGALLWRRDVCETQHEEEAAPRSCHHLLTLAGGTVVYCSHAGAVVAIDALTGKRLWGVRYPSRPQAHGLQPAGSRRGPAPCVAVDGRLFVAPLDSDRILCLDVETGRTLWEREGIEVMDVLGASKGRLLFTTMNGVRALAAADGGDTRGWRQPGVGRLASYGRGLLAGGWVFWPTRDAKLPCRALNQENGTQEQGGQMADPTRLRRLAPGNMAFGNGCLVVAGVEELVGYVPRK